MSKRWSYKNANVGKQHPSQTTPKSVNALLFTCLMEGGKGREGKYKGNKKLNGVKTCPKDWSVLLLLVQLKGLQGCKCWGK